MGQISFSNCVFEEAPSRRGSRAWLRHVGPLVCIAAGVGMWAAAVVWLLVRMGGAS